MTRPIVVGMDLSPASLVALEEAIPIARRRGVDILMVHVAPLPESSETYEWVSQPMIERYREMLDEEIDRTRGVLADIRERHSGQGVTISQALISGVAEAGIAEAAKERDATLIVVGSHSRTGLDRFLLGSVAERVSRFTDHDVLVARGERPKGEYKRILVPTDFSPTADRALAIAQELAADDATITLLHCFDVPPSVAGFFAGDLLSEVEAAALKRAKSVAETVKSSDVEVVVRTGHAGSVIRELAPGHDIIVMGSHGRSGFRRFLLGSVAEKTVRHAPCSVYIARAEDDSED